VIENRSSPRAPVIPVLAYEDAEAAARWLCDAFGFGVRLRIPNHRVQLAYRGGAVIVVEGGDAKSHGCHSVHVRVEDAVAHHERALSRGAKVLSPPTDHPYGERQYSAEDLGGHRWTFSQSIADADPSEWGGVAVDLDADAR
jgi:uncharacterized glyoxalase superfamily protein PhnB